MIITVDGVSEQVRTTRATVGELLSDLGLTLRAEDRVEPGPSTPLADGMRVDVRRARAASVVADGREVSLYTLAETVSDVLAAADVRLNDHDEVTLDGVQVAAGDALPLDDGVRGTPRFGRNRRWVGGGVAPVRITVRRAVPLTIDDGSVPYTIYTTAATLGEALLRESVTLYLGDQVQPALGSRVSAGMRVIIERSTPVFVTFDGKTVHTRTQGKSVGDSLVDLGIMVSGDDRVTPAMSERVTDNVLIRIVRVLQMVRVERQPIPYETILVPDDELEIDLQQVTEAGADGEYRQRYSVAYEDGQEITSTLTDDWVAAEPITRVVAYGRKIVSRELATAEGTFSYWRKVRMLASSYSAATSGVSRDSPYYGRTRLGWTMRKGVVAVDPTVIPLGSRVYVPGYGIGDAGDTGGAVRSKHIDLGYDDDNLVMWYRWVDVYLLDPPPPSSQIRWVLPNWPKE